MAWVDVETGGPPPRFCFALLADVCHGSGVNTHESPGVVGLVRSALSGDGEMNGVLFFLELFFLFFIGSCQFFPPICLELDSVFLPPPGDTPPSIQKVID